jgi:hypothetical protein
MRWPCESGEEEDKAPIWGKRGGKTQATSPSQRIDKDDIATCGDNLTYSYFPISRAKDGYRVMMVSTTVNGEDHHHRHRDII